MQRRVAIPSGGSFDLVLFARLDDEPGKYFVFAPDDGESSTSPIVPDDELKFTDGHDFFVELVHTHGRQKLKFDVKVKKGLTGRLSIDLGKRGGGSF